MRAVWFIVEPKRDQLVQIGELIGAGHLVPIVDTVLPLSDVHQAYVDKRDPNRRGKTVLRIGS